MQFFPNLVPSNSDSPTGESIKTPAGLQKLISRRVEIALNWILLIGFIGNFTSIKQDLYRPIDMAFSVYYAIWFVTMFVLLRKGKAETTFKLFCWGYWSYACLKALTVAGMHSPIIGSIAPLIIVTAWVHSKRAAILMLVLSVVYYGVLAQLESNAMLNPPLIRSSADLFVFYSMTAIAFMGIGLMIVDNAKTLMSTSTNLAAELTTNVNELRASQVELSRLNEELEQRVSQRTADLEQANHALTDTLQKLTATQRQLMDQEKMASLGSMVAGISHELNTPIGNALTIASMLEAKSGQVTEQVQNGKLSKSALENFLQDLNESSKILLRSVRRAVDLIQSFKRVAVDQTSEYRRTFSLREVVNDHVATFAPNLHHTGIMIAVEIADDIVCDSFPGALGQIIGNLIQNASIHGLTNSTTGKITISAQQNGEVVRLTVSDNGTGMPAHILSRIFDPFFTTRLGQGGSGIGLSICRRIATSILDGDLVAVSAPDQGATFTLTFRNVASGKL